MIIETFMINFYGDENTMENFDRAVIDSDLQKIGEMALEVRKNRF